MYVFPPSDVDGVHENMPVFEIIFAPSGGFFSKLNTTSLTELSTSLTVKDRNFPSSIVSFPRGLIWTFVDFGVAENSFDGSLVPTLLIAETLYVYFVFVIRFVCVYVLVVLSESSTNVVYGLLSFFTSIL